MSTQDFHQLQVLIARYNAGIASDEEKELVEQWYEEIEGEAPVHDEVQAENIKNGIFTGIQEQISLDEQQASEPQTGKVRYLFPLRKWAAACMILGVAGWLYFSVTPKKPELAETTPVVPGVGKVLPGGNLALLTLGNGHSIRLNEIKSGKIAIQGATEILKTGEGQIVYSVPPNEKETTDKISYNRITTPRGGTWLLVLPDKSRVWLNAASSLRFPSVFTGSERKVELTGEAYFEIASKPAMPFRVVSTGQTVEVIGTHFNINAYPDEPSLTTTLLEGSIKLSLEGPGSDSQATKHQSKLLKPGDQATTGKSDQIKVKRLDANASVAWKEGKFQFDGSDIYAIMRQISRWYDVDIDYKATPSTEGFKGKLPRNSELSKVFKILEVNGILCSLEGRKIIVRSLP